jgi:universal stress protein E
MAQESIHNDDTLFRNPIQIKTSIQEVLGEHHIPIDNIHIKAGSTSKVIPSLASKHAAGLVIIGSIGSKGLKAKLMGSKAESVLALLKTDILVIQP